MLKDQKSCVNSWHLCQIKTNNINQQKKKKKMKWNEMKKKAHLSDHYFIM